MFFVEHGLNEDRVAAVVADVGHHLNAHPLESGWWQFNYLPLLVVATEVGYRYRGSGTDFWPVLEAEFGIQISTTDRQRIRDFFASASQRYRGAQPPVTPWAEAFHLIAWPITHALVPLEFHRPLALTLANLRVNIGDLSDDDLHRAIRSAATSSSARFSTLLEDSALVVAVTKSLLGSDSAELCSEAVERIAADLASDQVARRGVAVARRIQRATAERTAPPISAGTPLPWVTGSLQLRRRDSVITLEAVFPQMQPDLQTRLRRALRRRRYAARLWGVSTPVPSEQLLSGLPFTVKLSTIPPEDAELLPALNDTDIDQDLRDALASFRLDIRPPLLFAVDTEEELGRRVLGSNISGHRKYWLLSEPNQRLQGGTARCQVGPYQCQLLDPAEESARDVLDRLGFQVRFGISIEFSGSPPLDRNAPVPAFAVGDQRYLITRRTPPEGLAVQLGDEQVHLTGDDVVTVAVGRGEHTLQVYNSFEEREFAFRGLPLPRSVPPNACSILPRSDDLTVQALLSGTLEFAVESFAPLNGLELSVEIEASGRRIFATAPLGPLPCSVSSNQEPFVALIDDATREQLAQVSSLMLRLSVGRLCTCSLVLEQRLRPCWWQRGDNGSITLTSEIGDLAFGWISATAPAALPTQGSRDSLEDARLLVPIDLDEVEYGGAAQFTTFCIAPSRSRLEVPAISKPRLTRRRRGKHGALGLEDVAESYLRWSLAESATLIAEIRRRQVAQVLDCWFTEICCGEQWVRREVALGGVDPWEALVHICDETGFGRDAYIELSRADEIEVTRIAVQEIRMEIPELWARVGPWGDLGPEDYEALDLACGHAYTELAGIYLKQGRDDIAAEIREGDPGAAADEWDAVLGRVKSMVEHQPLAEMLIPSDLAHGLMNLEPSILTLDELAEELTAWARNARRGLAGSVPPTETLKAILALWIEPEAAIRIDWRGALDVLLAERSVARAARYLALRSRRTAMGR